jgi:[protein-PII] uridylyltransferase
VRHHLLLPDVATRRDLAEPATIDSVAAAVGSLELLDLLAALTEADSIATGPSAWGAWKAELVNQLVTRVRYVLGGGATDDVLAHQFPTDAHLARMATRETSIEPLDDTLTVVAPDRPGLFSRVAGVLALHGLDVLAAAAHSSEDGMALAEFRVESSFGPVLPWARVIGDLERALQGRLALHARVQERARTYARRAATLPVAPPSVVVDSDASPTATVVEVRAPDAIGVLYRITRALAELDLDIRSAKVQTLGAQVVDSFYVVGPDGSKVTDPAHLGEIERSLLHELG